MEATTRLNTFKPTTEHFDRLLDLVNQLNATGQFEQELSLPHHIGTARKHELNQTTKGLALTLYEFTFNYDLPIDESHLQLKIAARQEPNQLPALHLQFCFQSHAFKNLVLQKGEAVYAFQLTLGHNYLIAFTEDLKYELPLEMEQALNLTVPVSLHSIENLSGKLQLYCKQLASTKLASGIRKNIYLESKVLGLLNFLFQHFNESNTAVSNNKFKIKAADLPKLQEAKSILLQQLREPLTISELARKVGLNENYLKRGFKELFHTTIHEFIQVERVENAKILLQQKGASVSQVGYELGFSCVSHFSASFKKITGINPSELISSVTE